MPQPDQATRLRRLAGAQQQPASLPQLPAIAITGGKGGVGKTSIATNLAILMQKMDLQPLLVDLDMGLANADVLLGVQAAATLFEVVVGGAPLRDALVLGPHGMPFIPAASGREELTHLSQQQFQSLLHQLQAMGKQRTLIFDTMAGISKEVMTFLRCAKVVVVVITPDPTSLTDAYALIKVLEQQQKNQDIRIIVNQCSSDDEAVQTFSRLQKVVSSYLARSVSFLGRVPRDRAVTQAVRNRRPFVCAGDCPAHQALRSIALRLKAIDCHT